MKVEVIVDGRAGRLQVDGGHLRYERDGRAIERDFSLEPLTPGLYSVLIGERSYEVIAAGGAVRVNGRAFSIEVFDPRSMRGRKTGAAGEGRQNVAAMMPGKVVRVLVAAGDAIEAGQGLIVVEAMKMQNEMKSPKAGRVVEVRTKADATVAAGDVLVVIE
ncbi:MAG TPA: biotin/lipoyl-containing protein [Bryobacteraceae bacterium]|nr:biotin/lipoyl-containing protein [Bryobacteraceae bacterium]